MNTGLLGGVEAGGTKMVCAVAKEPGLPLDEKRFSTTDPEETLPRVAAYFEQAQREFGELAAIGYATFGPAVVSEGGTGYGTILSTPKYGWQGVDVVGFLNKNFPGVVLSYDTDVNAAAIGEGIWGAARGVGTYIYITVGTGIGGGVIVDGRPLHTRPHAEIGHMLVPIQRGEVPGFSGVCPFHGACLEGLASGTAMHRRWGVPAEELEPDHEAWELEAAYLAAMVQNLVACYGPERIILGGGVMEQGFMLDRVREKFKQSAGGYWQESDDLLVRPGLGNQSGIIGALQMAYQSLPSE